MQVNSYLRMALMFGEDKAHTLYKNLERMIILVLYDFEKEKRLNQNSGMQDGLTVVGIIDCLKHKYSLNFSDSEVLQVIGRRGQDRIICISQELDSSMNKYGITPVEFEKISKRENQSPIAEYIRQFLENHNDVDFNEEQMLELLNRHFYSVFNSNAATILDLINRNYDYTQTLNTEQFEYTTEEKETINQFLYWDDAGKNKCVYEMVSCCFDYCMMTTKQNSSAFKDIFNKKVFYLDANIIFRLMGLNHENRKKVIDTFIKKCRQQKVMVKITNHTRQEVNDTIEYHVKTISNLLGSKPPLQPKAVWSMSTLIVNQSFYQAYYEWCKDEINHSADYPCFGRDLKKQANEILNQFEQKNFESFAQTSKDRFQSLVDSLADYKKKRHKSANDANIQTDVNNYMFVSACNNQTKGSDFFSIHNYLISADHSFGEWAKEINPGMIPVVVLPSVWYSIMLQYSGRSDDDYASFTSFLNFSLVNNESSRYSERKLEILKRVIALNERADIQSEIVYGIGEKLKSESIDLESEDIDGLIDDVRQGILDREVSAVRDEERHISEQRLEIFKTKAQQDLADMAAKSETELNLAKTENERLKIAAYEERGRFSTELKDAEEKAKHEEHDRIVNIETAKRTKRKYLQYWCLTVLMVLGSIAVVIGVMYWISCLKQLTDIQQELLNWIKLLFGILAFVGNGLVISIIFCGLNKDKIEAKIRKEVEKEYDNK
jgi:hypothetical protein